MPADAARPPNPGISAARIARARCDSVPNAVRPACCASVRGLCTSAGKRRIIARPLLTYPTTGPTRPQKTPRIPLSTLAITVPFFYGTI